MKLQNIEDQISLKRKALAIEKNPIKRSNLQKQLSKLGLRKEIEFIKNRITAME